MQVERVHFNELEMARRAGKGGGNAEKVADAGVTRESGFLYFIDKNGNALAGFTALTKPSSRKFINEIEKALSL